MKLESRRIRIRILVLDKYRLVGLCNAFWGVDTSSFPSLECCLAGQGTLCGIGSVATPCLTCAVVHQTRVRPDGSLQALTFLKVRKAVAGLQHHGVQFVIFHSTWLFTRFYPRATIIMAQYKKRNAVVILIIGD